MISTSSPFCSKIFHCCAANRAKQQTEILGYEIRSFVRASCENPGDAKATIRNAIARLWVSGIVKREFFAVIDLPFPVASPSHASNRNIQCHPEPKAKDLLCSR